MRPGVLSQDGFLGENESLKEVIEKDAETLKDMGITYDDLANKLDNLIKAAFSSGKKSARVGNYKIWIIQYCGFQICPWTQDIHSGQCTAGGGPDYSSNDWKIRNLRTKQEMSGSGLVVHLIREHHFFEGFETPYRVDPRELACLLELGPYDIKKQ